MVIIPPMRALLLLTLTTLSLPQQAVAAPTCLCVKCMWGSHDNLYAASASMEPTIRSGQCLDARFIEGDTSQITYGSIITFIHPAKNESFVYRVMALGGDKIQMRTGRVWLNGVKLRQDPLDDDIVVFEKNELGLLPRCREPKALGENCPRSQLLETLPNGLTHAVLDVGESPLDDTQLYRVPKNHVFVLGDHRDNAFDSRVPRSSGGPGFIPVENILGIVE